MQIACPHCGVALSLPDGVSERAVRCSSCGGTFRAPGVAPISVPGVAAGSTLSLGGRSSGRQGRALALSLGILLLLLLVIPVHVSTRGEGRVFWSWSALLVERTRSWGGTDPLMQKLGFGIRLASLVVAGVVALVSLIGKPRGRGASLLAGGLLLSFSSVATHALIHRATDDIIGDSVVSMFMSTAPYAAMFLVLMYMTAGGQLAAASRTASLAARNAPLVPAVLAAPMFLVVVGSSIAAGLRLNVVGGGYSGGISAAMWAVVIFSYLAIGLLCVGGILAAITGLGRGRGAASAGAIVSLLGIGLLFLSRIIGGVAPMLDSRMGEGQGLNVLLALVHTTIPDAAALLFVVMGYRLLWLPAADAPEPRGF